MPQFIARSCFSLGEMRGIRLLLEGDPRISKLVDEYGLTINHLRFHANPRFKPSFPPASLNGDQRKPRRRVCFSPRTDCEACTRKLRQVRDTSKLHESASKSHKRVTSEVARASCTKKMQRFAKQVARASCKIHFV